MKAAQIPISGSLLFLQTLIWGFFAPVWLLEAPLAGAGPAGLQKTPTRPPPYTHPVSTIHFWGEKRPNRSNRPKVAVFRRFWGDLGSGGARMPHPGGVPALPPPPDAPNRPKSPQIRRPSPHPPRAGPGGAQGGGGAHPVPATADLGGFRLKFEASPPPARSYTYSFWGQKSKFKHSCRWFWRKNLKT